LLPNLIVIGAQKAGTTSLHFYLGLHPQISMSAVKELNFFSGPDWNWDRGLDWYESHFDESRPVRGESSPSYASYPWVQGAPERMAAIVPDARLIYLVRDPIERMISAYVHRRASGFERRPIAEVFSDPRFYASGYVAHSRYHQQLLRYLEHFDPQRVLVVDHAELLRQRQTVLRRVFGFLGVDDAFSSHRYDTLKNTSGARLRGGRAAARARRLLEKARAPARARVELALVRAAPRPRLDDELRRALVDRFFREDVARLRELTGQRFESWSL
jgi:hypothetical protein